MNTPVYIILFFIIIAIIVVLWAFSRNSKAGINLTIAISILALAVSLFGTFKNEIFPFNVAIFTGSNLAIVNESEPNKNSPMLILPITFINSGYGSGVIDLIILNVTTPSGKKQIYNLVAELDYKKLIQGEKKVHTDNINGFFTSTVLNGRQSLQKYLLFIQDTNANGSEVNGLFPGQYTIELSARTYGGELKKEEEFEYTITNTQIDSIARGTMVIITDNNWDPIIE